MIAPVDRHADVVQQHGEDDDDLRVVGRHAVVTLRGRLHAVLHEESQELERDVRDDLDVHPRVVVDLQPEDGVHVGDVPPRLDLRVRVDPLEHATELSVPARGHAQLHRLDRLGRREPRLGDDVGLWNLDDVVRLGSGSHRRELRSSPPRRGYATSAAQSPYSRVYGPASVDQLVVGAGLHDPAVVEHDDRVGAADRREPVGDDERRSTGEEPAKAALDLPLRADVDRRGRLVEDEDARVGEERARERDELSLAERELEAPLADLRVVAVRELRDELVGADRGRGLLDLGPLRVGPAERDVVGDRPAEEEPLLRDDPELPPQRLLRDLAKVGAVDRDATVARVVETREELGDGRLSGSRVTDERDGGACGNVEVEVVQDVGELAVAEPDVVEADMSLDRGELARVVRVDDVRLLVEDAP